LHQDNRVPLVAVNIWYHVGSGDETPGKSGFAHLFEHMLFQGSKHVGEDKHFEVLKNIGATGVNGTTNPDRTNYFEVVPSHQLETALWLESDRMGYLLPMVTKKSLDNQIEVVRNERRQRYDNVPYGKTRFVKASLLYPEGHPYRYLTIGKHSDLTSASLDDVVGFYKKWYPASNATLVIAGDFETAQVKKLVQKWFGSFPKQPKPARQQVKAPIITKAKREKVEDKFAKLRRLEYVWPSPRYYGPGDAELDLFANALAANGVGRLYEILVHKKQWAQSVSAYQGSRQFSSEFTVSITLKPDADLAKVEKIVNRELDKLRKRPMKKAEFDRAVVAMEKGFIWNLESLSARANMLQSYNHFVGDPGYISKDLDRWRKSSPAKIRKVAEKVLAPNRRIEVLTVPAKKTASKGGNR
ncbi:MAG: insulinase family protein, partial [Deltaproteobacteria bacterium]|nr:insulinase family protein [Deltaproteobacteria bacterium]